MEFAKIFFSRGSRNDFVHGIEVRGSAEFQGRTREALALLQPLPEFALIRAYLGLIRQGKRSGMRAWATPSTFTVGAATWNHSALWYAGAIAHDAYHAKLYRDAKFHHPGVKPRADAWTGAVAERACLVFQRGVLARLDAAPSILAYLEFQERNPTYQGRNQGWQSWLDYHKRWW
ncbi:MAG: hypothetical protein ACM3SP_19110 [Chloroflexota bacterium]